MPSNNVCVNHVLNFEVNDSRMVELMEWLQLNSWDIKDSSKGEETIGVCHNLDHASSH